LSAPVHPLARAGLLAVPLALLLSIGIAASGGAGAGLAGGVIGVTALSLQVGVSGGLAARAAVPDWARRSGMALGLAAVVANAAATQWQWAPRLMEAGVALTLVSGWSQFLVALSGRATAMPDR
jgi:hypothetical protein